MSSHNADAGTTASRLGRPPPGVSRRHFVCASAASALAGQIVHAPSAEAGANAAAGPLPDTTLFLCGDVMLGRGIDQVLPHPVDPVLQEPYVKSARDYVRLAERASGPIPRNVAPAYVWGDALAMLREVGPAARIVNLETSITDRGEFWPKAVNYRMSPRHTTVLAAAGIECCSLANNHVMDFGQEGLLDTLVALSEIGIPAAGAGDDAAAATAPVVIGTPGERRIVVFAYGSTSSGIPREWAAGSRRPGVNLLPDLSNVSLAEVVGQAEAARRPGDLLVASIHWGGNWGHAVPAEQVRFARGLIDGGFDVVHGHSSHHAKAIEIFRGKPILYGCGDFITDYEGISGHEEFRGDLALAYLPRFAGPLNRLADLRLVPFRMRRFRLERAGPDDALWLAQVLEREGRRFGTAVALGDDGTLEVGGA